MLWSWSHCSIYYCHLYNTFALHYLLFVTRNMHFMVCIASLHASLVHHYWAWLVLFHCRPDWFFLTGHGLYCLTSCLTGSSLFSMVALASDIQIRCYCLYTTHVTYCNWPHFVLYSYQYISIINATTN